MLPGLSYTREATSTEAVGKFAQVGRLNGGGVGVSLPRLFGREVRARGEVAPLGRVVRQVGEFASNGCARPRPQRQTTR